MLGMIPPDFFGEDMDYNPFDILSTIMCIFEGSTICAIMSALPLFSPFIDALSTFSVVRKIFNRFGSSGAGKRSKAAIKKAQAAEVAKLEKKQEAFKQLESNIHIANKNLELARAKAKAKGLGDGADEIQSIKKELKKLSEDKLKMQKEAIENASKKVKDKISDGKKFLDNKKG